MLKIGLGVLATVLMVCPCLAQTATTEPAKPASTTARRQFYRLDFVIRELDGTRVVNSRTFSILTTEHARDSIRTGAKVPANNSYLNVGVNIDCFDAEQVGNQLAMNVTAEVSSLADTPEKSSSAPVIRNNTWNSHVILPLKHPTVLFSSDDLASTRKMQLELTATPIE